MNSENRSVAPSPALPSSLAPCGLYTIGLSRSFVGALDLRPQSDFQFPTVDLKSEPDRSFVGASHLGSSSDFQFEGEKSFFSEVLRAFLGIGLVCGLVGCKQESEELEPPAQIVQVRQVGSDFQLPSSLWDRLLPEEAAAKMAVPSDIEDPTNQAVVNFAPVVVVLTERNDGVLTKSPIHIEFPQGGGTVDLADYVTGQPGTFYVNFNIAGLSTPETLAVYYLSSAKKRKFENQIFGSGCNSYSNVKKAFLSHQGKKGFAVNTTRNLHATILGGHFIFSWQNVDAFLVTQVQFKDSRYPQLFCANQDKSEGPQDRESEEAGQ